MIRSVTIPLASASVLVLNAGIVSAPLFMAMAPTPAYACGGITTITNTSTISTLTTNCIRWLGGNLTIASGGVVDTSYPFYGIEGAFSDPNAVLDNAGIIRNVDPTGGEIAAIGVNPDRSIGAIINSGTIYGANYGIEAGGGVLSGGSIRSIVNSGTIMGGAAAINIANLGYSARIDTIVNSGLIAGNITSASDYSLHISGGTSAGTRGVLTGSGGTTSLADKGLIAHTAADLNFYAGYLLLNDDINVGTYTVRNTGADLMLANNITITGKYTQTSGVLQVRPGSSTLTVTGAAVISGGKLSVELLADGNYISGTFATLVSGGAGTTYSGFLVEAALAGLSNNILINNNALLLSYNNHYVGSTLASLDNTTTVGRDYGLFIASTGDLGTLNNSGTLRGSSQAIYNLGTLGTIVNSGTIAGEIYNDTANNMTISGGATAAQMGILTGYSQGLGFADKGYISHMYGDLTFGSGYLLLNDEIGVGPSNTVHNTGAVLQLNNQVGIWGSYNQTGGGLISTANNGTNGYGQLQVSENATITGSTITVSGPNLEAGQQFTVVTASGIGAYSNNSAYVKVTNGLGARLQQVGNDLVVVLVAGNTANTYSAKGGEAGGRAAPFGAALDAILGSGNAADFQPVFDAIDNLPLEQQGNALKQLGPTNVVHSSHMAVAANAALDPVRQRQQTQGSAGSNASGYMPMAYAPIASSAEDPFAELLAPRPDEWAIWGQVIGGGAWLQTQASVDGFSQHNFGLIAGLDHHFTDQFMGGAAMSWVRSGISPEGNGAGSSISIDSFQGTVYGSYRFDRAFVDAQMGLGWNQFDQSRSIGFLGSTASAQYSGQHYVAAATLGYDIPVSALTITPTFGLRLFRTGQDGYAETGAGPANLTVAGNGQTSVSQNVGVRLGWATPLGDNGTIRTEASVAWTHDYADGTVATNVTLGGQALTLSDPNIATDGLRLGLGATLDLGDGLSVRTQYDGEVRAHYQSHTGQLKLAKGF